MLGCFSKTELTELGKLGKATQFYLENLVNSEKPISFARFCSVLLGFARKNQSVPSSPSSVNSVPSNACGSVIRPPAQGIAAVTTLLDFIYLAQYPAHDSDTLQYLQEALDQFHKNREYFIITGIRKDFNIPKFHSLLHYIEAIKLFGTTDNYNTEMFEWLHIDFAKHGWRASNQ